MNNPQDEAPSHFEMGMNWAKSIHSALSQPQQPQGYAQGTDNVPAMLSPREAVLNRNAAELMGRHKIRAANTMGNQLARQGIDLSSQGNAQQMQPPVPPSMPPQAMNPMMGAQQQPMMPPPLQSTPQTFPPPAPQAPQQFQNPLQGYQSGTSDVITDPNDPSLPINQRARYVAELKDPTVARQVYNLTHNEVGGQGPQAQQAFIETLFNRAGARNQTLAQTINDKNYYPASSFKPVTLYPDQEAHYASLVDRVAQGSNISNGATGNASGNVDFGGGPRTASYGGENFGREKPDLNAANLTGLPQGQYPTVPYAPTGGAGSPSYNAGASAYAASQAEQAGAEAETEKANPWATAGKQLGEDIQKQAAAQEAQSQSQMKTAMANVPTSNPILAALSSDPTSPYRMAQAMSQYPVNKFQSMFGS